MIAVVMVSRKHTIVNFMFNTGTAEQFYSLEKHQLEFLV